MNVHDAVSSLCDPATYRYLTVRRDPFQRFWSHCQIALRDPEWSVGVIAAKGLKQ